MDEEWEKLAVETLKKEVLQRAQKGVDRLTLIKKWETIMFLNGYKDVKITVKETKKC